MLKNESKNIFNNTEYHDGCGIGFIVESTGSPSRRVIDLSIKALKKMSHRGAYGADEKTGDGVGLLVDIPKKYFATIVKAVLNIDIDHNDPLGIAMVFTEDSEVTGIEEKIQSNCNELKIKYLGKRIVPVNHSVLGEIATETCPEIIQYFFKNNGKSKKDFETKLYLLRKSIESHINLNKGTSFICSLSSRTIVYKGMMGKGQLIQFYHDLNQLNFIVCMSVFHERFSTNTISSWSMAQPFRMIAHNGEINTIKGNRLWMKAREEIIQSSFWGKNIEKLKPLVSQSGSDSFSLDNILEFLSQSGKNLFQSIMMLIPQPYLYDSDMEQGLKDFYAFHENHIEPWDGPAALVFTDGDIVAAKLDRNGLRPLRYTITKDGLIIMASEAGVVDISSENVLIHHHMKAGENFAVRLNSGEIISDDEILNEVIKNESYSEKIKNNLVSIDRISDEKEFGEFSYPLEGFDRRLRIAFGIDKEDFERFIIPMSESGRESVGSMGDDTSPAMMSQTPRRLYDYFKQYFAQVTNPPIDPIRERYVMSLVRYIGSEENLLSESDMFKTAIRIEGPVLSPGEVKLLLAQHDWFPYSIIKCHVHPDDNFEKRLNIIKSECEIAVQNGTKIIFFSDEGVSESKMPIPMLLAVSAVHQHLVEKRIRNKAALLCFTGDVIEDHHVACLISFGASAVYPYMAYELIREHYNEDDWVTKLSNYRYALEKGLLKIMDKMGISTVSSYHGSMLHHGIGISQSLIENYFPSVKSVFGGLDLETLKDIQNKRREKAFILDQELEEYGRFRYRKNGEQHGFSPTIFKNIQNIALGNSNTKNTGNDKPVYIRDLLDIVGDSENQIDHIDQIEPDEEILKRFGLGAMSFGAVSEEVHRTLARAASTMNIRSNTGEGGEQKDRYSISNPDKSENCYVKQIASGRFGVTPFYLSAGREIQIKMAQGAKPGEGGQLPGEKVTLSLANDRHTTPGVPLISPPPHHDIYSIEDIAQLIYDLKQVNPRANICVKLVSQFGIGIIASGVVKAGADIVLVSGNDGGTGASPLGSIKHTGLPWEIGLTEVHRTLTENGLRKRVVLRVDGGIKNAKDIIVAALLGAEEYDFGTSALVALGCIMARRCHLNNCPAGIATQDEELRKKFKGKPENLVNYLKNVAHDVRSLLFEIDKFSLDDIIGNNELLAINDSYRSLLNDNKIDLSTIIKSNNKISYFLNSGVKIKPFSANPEQHIDEGIIEEVRPAIMNHGRAIVNRVIDNTNRAVGTRLSGLISFLYGQGEYKGHIQYKLEGAAGQSLGAFLVDNIEIRHMGVANDYVGRGMSGGLISIRFPRNFRKSLEGNTIIGNVALYGATGGELFVSGKAGERFAVRNSGAAAVVEGVGNHCCEYMTRGVVIVLGEMGKNFGAGMTGGAAFIWNAWTKIENSINKEYVRLDKINTSDEDLILKILHNHEFHTGSTIAEKILSDWDNQKRLFVKVVPLALDMINFKEMYKEQYYNRKLQVFNE
jgi:glutamate synthase domain-containing protein 2/glutamate synthase domain-containing protein 1/glutamate synthase domain-containing protein 3